MISVQEVRENLKRANLLSMVENLCAARMVHFENACGRSRRKSAVAARHEAWSLIRSSTEMSSVEIGALFGVDHSTVLDGIKNREAKLSKIYAEQAGGRVRVA